MSRAGRVHNSHPHNGSHHHHLHHHDGPQPSQGYMQLAGLMSRYPEGAIFRRFGEMTMLHLLYLQGRLQDLESQYQKTTALQGGPLFSAIHEGPENTFSIKDMREFTHNQREILEKVGPLVAHYNSLLLQAAQMAERWKPSDYESQFLSNWLSGTEASGRSLKPEEVHIWRRSNEKDFVSLCSPDQRGAPISSWFAAIANFVQDVKDAGNYKSGTQGGLPYSTHDVEGGQTIYHARSSKAREFEVLRKIIMTLAASLFPVITILTLYFIPSTLNRIYATLGFSVGFGVLFKIFTNCGMKEIFMACATLAAVEVVFIGSADGGR